MDTFYIGLFEYLRTVVGDSGFKEIDLGSNIGYRDDKIVVIHGNREIKLRLSIKEIESGETDDD